MRDTAECHISPFWITWSWKCYIEQVIYALFIVFPSEIHLPKYIRYRPFFITETTLLLQVSVGFYITPPTTTPPPSLWHRHNECCSMQIILNQGRVRIKEKENLLFLLNAFFTVKLKNPHSISNIFNMHTPYVTSNNTSCDEDKTTFPLAAVTGIPGRSPVAFEAASQLHSLPPTRCLEEWRIPNTNQYMFRFTWVGVLEMFMETTSAGTL